MILFMLFYWIMYEGYFGQTMWLALKVKQEDNPYISCNSASNCNGKVVHETARDVQTEFVGGTDFFQSPIQMDSSQGRCMVMNPWTWGEREKVTSKDCGSEQKFLCKIPCQGEKKSFWRGPNLNVILYLFKRVYFKLWQSFWGGWWELHVQNLVAIRRWDWHWCNSKVRFCAE